MESQLVSEFMSITGAKQNDAVSCLKTWAWDLKRALTDYNDTYTNEIENKQTADDVEYEEITTTSIQGDFQNSLNQRRSKLTKSDSVDIVDYRKLSRGISRATDNVNLVSRARTEIAMDFHNNREKNIEQLHSIDTPDYTFILPNIFNYPNPFRCFLERDLVECSTLSALEQTQRLNWWVESGSCRKLWPLATTGDGNCLLHAASLGMWGFHDRKLTLRRALYSILSTGKCKDSLLRRWRFQQTRFNKKAGFVYSENEWKKEWDEIVAMASPEPRNNSHNSKDMRKQRLSTPEQNGLSTECVDDLATYESLEEIHILALAHVLRRTIIVIADTVLRDLNGEAMAPIPFGGIYLPFEISANECNRGPLLLAYDMAHFSALVTMESENDFPPPLIPLTDYENILLPIQFCIDPGEDFDWKTYDGSEGNWALTDREHITLLREYLDIVYATNTRSPEDEIYEDLTDDEFEKKFSESEVTIGPPIGSIGNFSNDENHTNNKSKAAKQLQSVAKQFGSIGKSMSKKIKKNIGSITKIGGKNLQKKTNLSSGNSTQSFTCMRILCARLRVKRHDFQEEMIRNYLECAHSRFLESEKNKEKQDVERHNLDLINDTTNEIDRKSSFVYCINTGCNNFASSDTSYLCPDCFEKQCHRESAAFLDSAPRYGTGKSKFYTQADTTSHDSIKQLPSVRRLNELDQTLYLSNSTFYNDNVTGYNEIGIPNRESFYRHGYSPTVKLTDNNIKIDEQLGTVSVFSPGNTINNKSQNINSNMINVVELPSSVNHQNLNRVSSSSSSAASAASSSSSSSSPCRTHGCMYYGSANNNFYCSRCCQKRNSDTVFSNASQQNIVYNTTAASTTTPTSIAKTNSKIMSDI